MKQVSIKYNQRIFAFFILAILFNVGNLFCQTSEESLFNQGNKAYNTGAYKEAISFYKQTLKKGKHSAELYFNLGNAYYRLNKVAESIYYFEKAKQLNQLDEDILINIAFAKNMTIDAIETLPESQIDQIQKKIFGIFSFSMWSFLTVALLWIFVILFLVYLFFNSVFMKRTFFFSALIVFSFFIGSFFVTFSIDQRKKNIKYAILFSSQIDIWSEPNQQGELLFTLHEGTKIQLLDDLDEWKKIRISNGSEGWILNADIWKLN